jgi:predicted peptidase
MKKFIVFVLAAFLFTSISAQEKSVYSKMIFVRGNDTLPYRILYPSNYKSNKKYAVLLFLHGSGERGSDNELQLTHGWKLFADSMNRAKYPAFVIFPQCPLNESWARLTVNRNTQPLQLEFLSNEPMTKPLSLVSQLMDSLASSGKVNKKKIYLGGLSMGGMGTFDLLWRKPGFFAAAFPICGGGDTSKAAVYGKNFPIWVFHGDADPAVDVNNSRKMVAALKAAKAKVKYSEYPGVKHDSWTNAFAEPELLNWIFEQKKR